MDRFDLFPFCLTLYPFPLLASNHSNLIQINTGSPVTIIATALLPHACYFYCLPHLFSVCLKSLSKSQALSSRPPQGLSFYSDLEASSCSVVPSILLCSSRQRLEKYLLTVIFRVLIILSYFHYAPIKRAVNR